MRHVAKDIFTFGAAVFLLHARGCSPEVELPLTSPNKLCFQHPETFVCKATLPETNRHSPWKSMVGSDEFPILG